MLNECLYVCLIIDITAVVRIIIGSNEYRKWGEGILQAVQYKKINRYALFVYISFYSVHVICYFCADLLYSS